MNESNNNFVGVELLGARVGISASGLHKPVKRALKGIISMLGFTKRNVHKAATKLAERTE